MTRAKKPTATKPLMRHDPAQGKNELQLIREANRQMGNTLAELRAHNRELLQLLTESNASTVQARADRATLRHQLEGERAAHAAD